MEKEEDEDLDALLAELGMKKEESTAAAAKAAAPPAEPAAPAPAAAAAGAAEVSEDEGDEGGKVCWLAPRQQELRLPGAAGMACPPRPPTSQWARVLSLRAGDVRGRQEKGEEEGQGKGQEGGGGRG